MQVNTEMYYDAMTPTDITPDDFAAAVINALTNNRPGTVPGETQGPLLPNLSSTDGL
jgi:hypothetical protein